MQESRTSYLPMKCNADVSLYVDSEAVAEHCNVWLVSGSDAGKQSDVTHLYAHIWA
jgi:hypothetical protein